MSQLQVRKNILFSLIFQLITAISGLFIPNLILKTYGPSIHGLISTLNNLMNYVMFLNAGLGTVAVQSLYKPLVENDSNLINSTLNAIRKHYNTTALFMLITIIGISMLLPLIIRDGISNTTLIVLMIIMGTQYVLENVLFNTECSLAQADNKLYIISLINSISYVFRIIIQVLTIKNKLSIIIVAFVPVPLVVFRSVLLKKYTYIKYSYIDRSIIPENNALSKRKFALIHQLSGLILNNTDVIVLSIFWNQSIVSKYSVYSMVFAYLYLVLNQMFSSSIVADFGKRINISNRESVYNSFKKVSLTCRYCVTIVYSTAFVMVIPFVSLYTKGIVGIEYADSFVGTLFVIYGTLNALRIPYIMLIDAAGMYRETQHQAIIEMVINLVVSIILAKKLGIIGVLIGTIASFIYRTTATIIFTNNKLLFTSSKSDLAKSLLVFILIFLIYKINMYLPTVIINNWLSWLIQAAKSTLISLIISTFTSFIVDRKNCLKILKKE